MISVIAFIFFILIWFLPTFVARSRKLKNKVTCGWINLAIGWLLPVWVILMLWSLLIGDPE
jgi:hypothetical protein